MRARELVAHGSLIVVQTLMLSSKHFTYQRFMIPLFLPSLFYVKVGNLEECDKVHYIIISPKHKMGTTHI